MTSVEKIDNRGDHSRFHRDFKKANPPYEAAICIGRESLPTVAYGVVDLWHANQFCCYCLSGDKKRKVFCQGARRCF